MLSHASVNTIAALFAVLISIAAAIFSWQQVDIARLHNKLSVTPLVRVTPYAKGLGEQNGLYMANGGLGPALIKEFRVSAGNLVAEGFAADRWTDLLKAADVNPNCFATAWPRQDDVVVVGGELALIYITKAEGSQICHLEMLKLIGGKGVSIKVAYESVYGERFLWSGTSKINSKSVEELYRQLIAK